MAALTGGCYSRSCGLSNRSSFHIGSLGSSSSRRSLCGLLVWRRGGRLRLRRIRQRIVLPLGGGTGLLRGIGQKRHLAGNYKRACQYGNEEAARGSVSGQIHYALPTCGDGIVCGTLSVIESPTCGSASASCIELKTGTSEPIRVTSRSTRLAGEPATRRTSVSRPATSAMHSNRQSTSSWFNVLQPDMSTTTGEAEVREAFSNSLRRARRCAELDMQGNGRTVHSEAFTAAPEARPATRSTIRQTPTPDCYLLATDWWSASSTVGRATCATEFCSLSLLAEDPRLYQSPDARSANRRPNPAE
jgi:hypothetical protein